MWPKRKRTEYLKRSNELLISRYGIPRHGNKTNPLDEVGYIILSAQTDENKYQSVYRELKKRFPKWANIQRNDESIIEQILRPSGLSKLKAKYIVRILDKLDADFGKRSLASLKTMPDEEAEKYLASLLGIGPKSARCVLMYSLGRKVFPVDTHNFRVLKRLGAHNFPLPIRRWHDELQKIIPEDLRYSLHVTLVSLGREICRATRPACEICPLSALCCYAKANRKGGRAVICASEQSGRSSGR
ncbi:MAG: DNA-cytosine methyltransferase [Acidobacteria bacterium]|nr:DNA-cytosine methyltransferase [Acidobacteriota bacterium]